jgi:hypothetical protein
VDIFLNGNYSDRCLQRLEYLGVREREKERKEGTGNWRKFHNEELHNSYSSPNMNRKIKSRKKKL